MIVITGGGSGIGRELAVLLAQKGESVCIIGRRENLLADVKAKHPQHIDYVCADVATDEGRRRVLAHVGGTALKAIAHNAGIIEPILPMTEITETDWHHILNVNLNAPLFLTKMLAPQLQHGKVLHVGSGAAYFPVAGWAAYCVSKAGLAMLTRCCQLEFEGIAFASVMPGIVDTNMQDTIRQSVNMAEEKRDFFIQLKQTNQLLSPMTVAGFMTWLLLEVDVETFASQEWDVYDRTHHGHWLKPPFYIPDVQ